jgi:hypothetical protein
MKVGNLGDFLEFLGIFWDLLDDWINLNAPSPSRGRLGWGWGLVD